MRLSRTLHVFGDMESLVIACLRITQEEKCADCKSNLAKTGFQIDHKRYEEDINLKDLQLLCGPCHAKKSGAKSVQGTLRWFQTDPQPYALIQEQNRRISPR